MNNMAAHTPAPTAAEAMHVIARVGSERFAFRVADVEEVLDAPAIVAAPIAPPGLAGQIRHRDRMIRAYDAAWTFGVARWNVATTALVIRVAGDRIALLVDDVEDLTALAPDVLRAAPPGTDPGGLLRGVCLPRECAASGAAHGALVAVVNAAAVVSRASQAVRA